MNVAAAEETDSCEVASLAINSMPFSKEEIFWRLILNRASTLYWMNPWVVSQKENQSRKVRGVGLSDRSWKRKKELDCDIVTFKFKTKL